MSTNLGGECDNRNHVIFICYSCYFLSIILLSGTYLYLYFRDEKMVRLAKSSVTGTVVGLGLGTAIGWFMNDFKFKELNNQSVTDVAKDAIVNNRRVV